MYCKGDIGQAQPPFFVFQFGAPNGYVYIFHVPSSVPKAIRDLAGDPNIFCIQSAALEDKVNLNDVSISFARKSFWLCNGKEGCIINWHYNHIGNHF